MDEVQTIAYYFNLVILRYKKHLIFLDVFFVFYIDLFYFISLLLLLASKIKKC
jgi:hypothetical protein